MINDNLKNEIIKALKPISPDRVILFGSYAYGNPEKNSDIDLLVVTNENYFPKNFSEKNEIYLKVSSRLRAIQKEYPIDIIVHTKPMFEKFIELDSMFARKILKSGINLL
jgi:predicted nucleotidyltransferase